MKGWGGKGKKMLELWRIINLNGMRYNKTNQLREVK